MAQTPKQDYCLWTANCNVLGTEKFEDCEKYRCCYTCPKKPKCSFACVDRDTKSHTCRFLISKEEAKSNTVCTFSRHTSTPKESAVEVSPQQQEEIPAKKVDSSSKLPKKSSDSKAKKLWKVEVQSIPSSVKDLASQTGATYARANYLIRTKKLSFEEAFKILVDKG